MANPTGDREARSVTTMAELVHLKRSRGIGSPMVKRQRADSPVMIVIDPGTTMDRCNPRCPGETIRVRLVENMKNGRVKSRFVAA